MRCRVGVSVNTVESICTVEYMGDRDTPPCLMNVRLYWTAEDPFAVTATFRWGSGKPVEWLFAVDLLTEGVHHRAGDGDVTVMPDPDEYWSVRLVLSSPSGVASFKVPADFVDDFVADVDDELLGNAPVVDWDSAICKLLEIS